MLWFSLLMLLVGSALVCCWMTSKCHLECRQNRASQTHSEISENSLLVSRTAAECCSLLASLEDHKTQLYHRLAMLDEMIEKSDREIAYLHEQLARMDYLCSHPLNDTSRDMLTLLRAGGFEDQDIEHLTLRHRDELDEAA